MRDPVAKSRRALRAWGVLSLIAMCVAGPAGAADDLADMDLEDLMSLKVTSASKREQNLVDAAAAITVLTQEDIRRSGATSVPELLRLVPGLNVARIDASRWAISSRGYNGQFANKLLVLLDGRVLYTPLFGGVYWDVQDVVLADIDRIEVIRGPGGTLWGANAVNGVINITTKSAKDTQGVHAMGLAGNQEYIGEGRVGGQLGEDTAYRVYGRGFKRDDFTFPDGSGFVANDEWYQWRVGARVDSQFTERDLLTVQGDFYDGENDTVDSTLAPLPSEDVRGGNALTRWTHELGEKQSLEAQGYYDFTQRNSSGVQETRHTVDLLLQHNFILGERDQWLFNWGLEYMWTGDDIRNSPGIAFVPDDFDFNRFSGFAQVQWNLFDGALELIGGTKLEYNNYTDFEYQPTGRALWKFVEGNAVWGSISRAVRAPTRVDRDIVFGGGLAVGSTDIQSEDLTAYEFGYRNYMFDRVSFDLALFFNDYDDMTVLQGAAPPTFANGLESRSWGGEVQVAWQPTDDLHFVTSYAYLQIDDDPAPGAVAVFGTNDGASPQHTWMLKGEWDLPVVPVEFDSTVWYVSALPARTLLTGGTVSSYWRLDLRLAWQATDWLGLEAVGQNLTSVMHAEWGEGLVALFPGDFVPRSYYGKVTLTF